MVRKKFLKRMARVGVLASTALVAVSANAQIAPTVSSGPLRPFYGNIAPFYGNIAPFYGNIAPFYGNIAPFYGNIAPFYGNIAPFYGNIAPFWGDLSPFYGNIAPFWGSLAPAMGAAAAGATTPAWSTVGSFWQSLGSSWTSLDAAWGSVVSLPTTTAGSYAPVASQLNAFVDQSAAFWGAAVTAKTGKSFRDGYAAGLFAKYGIDPNDPASLAKMSQPARASFMLDWYDGLMEFSGVDHVDHWMKTINWTPSITEIQGEGRRSVIGLLDFAVSGDADVRNNIVSYNGVSNFTNGHGAAVASLMVAAHDGKGVMGIAPMASVVAYNPFDATGTASWADVTRGVAMLAGTGGASIVNMSLGVPGMTLDGGWKNVFSAPSVVPSLKNTVFVTAAGNDSKAQTQNIVWDFNNDPALIVVGSVDPTGQISAFSNQPGTACLTKADLKCDPKNQLMNRFIVAPGELILVSDDNGGVTRQSGTSFAAPLVSGTVALLHNRWPWLASYPKETVQIVLQSAKDLGAPGIDPVYGVGLLDVTAANSPLNFNNVKWYNYVDGKLQTQDVKQIRDPKQQAQWEAKGIYFYAYEPIGGTFRDFAIPLSSKLLNGTAISADGTLQYLQTYIYSRMSDWLKGTTSTSGSGFANFAASAAVRNPYGLNVTMTVAPRNPARAFHAGDLPYQSSLRLASPDEGFALRLGHGDGAVAFGSATSGFGLFSDYDVQVGGVNPLLGMASGGGYAGAEVALTPGLRLSAGISGNDSRRNLDKLSSAERAQRAALAKYRTGAQHLTLAYQANDAVGLSATVTHLDEADALLGLQSLDPNDFRGGASSDGVTLGADIKLASTVHLSASGTLGKTGRGDPSRQNIAVSSGGVVSTAFELALSANKLFDRSDRLRVTLSQPMHLESGKIDVTTVQVIDRQTGTLGPVTQTFDIGAPKRQFLAEAIYGRSLPNGMGEMSLFGRASLRPSATADTQTPDYVVGGRFSIGF